MEWLTEWVSGIGRALTARLPGVTDSLLANVIFLAIVSAVPASFLFRYWNSFMTYIRPPVLRPRESPIASNKLRPILTDRLQQGQTRKPEDPHFGQFGEDLPRSQRFQFDDQDLTLTPRMYRTSWPGIVLARRRLLPRNVALATKGVERLFRGSIDKRIYGAPSPSAEPGRSPLDRPAQVISYRHTICGAWFLYCVQGRNAISKNVLTAMLDPGRPWQNSDGGWAASEHTASDIWTSAYAAQFLDKAMADGLLSTEMRSLASAALNKSIIYLKNCWERSHWATTRNGAEENSVLILIEIAPLLLSRDDKVFVQTVIKHMETWLDPSRNYLREDYLSSVVSTSSKKTRDISASALYTRMSYALYRAGSEPAAWFPLYQHAAKTLDDGYYSSDLAFLLDLTYPAAEHSERIASVQRKAPWRKILRGKAAFTR